MDDPRTPLDEGGHDDTHARAQVDPRTGQPIPSTDHEVGINDLKKGIELHEDDEIEQVKTTTPFGRKEP